MTVGHCSQRSHAAFEDEERFSCNARWFVLNGGTMGVYVLCKVRVGCEGREGSFSECVAARWDELSLWVVLY